MKKYGRVISLMLAVAAGVTVMGSSGNTFAAGTPEVSSAESPVVTEKDPVTKKTTPGSVSFVPSVAGLIIAGEVVKDLIGRKTK